jgi:uncharacterized protein (TIGR03067 family)
MNERSIMGEQSTSWYIPGEGKQPVGPFTAEQLFQSWRAGKLSDTTMCWREGMVQWLPLTQVEPFASAIRLAGVAGHSTKPPASPSLVRKGSPTAPATLGRSPARSKVPLVLVCTGGVVAAILVAVLAMRQNGGGAPAGPSGGEADSRPAPADAKDALQGAWVVQSWNGRSGLNPSMWFRFQGDKLLLSKLDGCNYSIDCNRSPWHLDFAFGGNPAVGIFDVKGDRLTICFNAGVAAGRPTEFAAGPQSQPALIVLARLTAEQQKAIPAIERVEKAGGTVEIDKSPGGLCHLDYFHGFPARGQVATDNNPGGWAIAVKLFTTDADLERLKECLKEPQFQVLDITGNPQGGGVTDAGLEHLQGLTQLRKLRLYTPSVTGAGLQYLRGLTQLQVLDLERTQTTDAALEYLSGLTHIRELRLDTKVTGDGLKHLRNLTELQKLDIGYKGMTDAGLEHLRGLTQLQELNLNGSEITDAGLDNIKGLKNLKTLNLWNTQVTDAGIEHLKGLTQLKKLQVGRTGVTDAGLAYFSGFSELEELDITQTGVTDSGLVHLSGLTHLHTLYVSQPHMTVDGLDHLNSLTQLRELNLCGTWLTDAALEHLKGLTELRELSLHGNRLTDAGVEHLKAFTQLQKLDLWEVNGGMTGIADLTSAEADKIFRALPRLTFLNGKQRQSWLDESQHESRPTAPPITRMGETGHKRLRFEKRSPMEPGTCIHEAEGLAISLVGIRRPIPWEGSVEGVPAWTQSASGLKHVFGQEVLLELAITKMADPPPSGGHCHECGYCPDRRPRY